jgi:hypothetical protein
MIELGMLIKYVRDDLARLIRQRAKEIGVTRKTLYKRARRYWQSGQPPNAQLSHYRNLRHRETLGSSTEEAMPYSLFEVDATLVDVYLVNRQDGSKIIGNERVES